MKERAIEQRIEDDELEDLIFRPVPQAAVVQLSCDAGVSQELPSSLDGLIHTSRGFNSD
jgi:hypothetical protein